MMNNKNNFFKLSGKVQHYQWGGDTFIPQLLGIENPKHEPFAEYWMGAHESGPGILEGTSPASLQQYIHDHPSVLGSYIRNTFRKLPYLLKILDVKDMLSIQVHPDKKSAEVEFARENSSGVALNATTRNYKDDNHKPELMLALSDFWLLHGFKEPKVLKDTFTSVKELAFLDTIFDKGSYKAVYTLVMEMDQHKVNMHLDSLLSRIVPAYQEGSLRKDQADFWAARAALTFNKGENIDRGIFSVYMLNLVNLKPGEAIFQDAGILHAYLEGQNVEIMANSDNVLRGGLTPKHIDVRELIKHVSFGPVIPLVIDGESISVTEKIYETPAPDFQLSSINLSNGRNVKIEARTTEIFFLFEGTVEVANNDKKLAFKRGEAFTAFEGAHLDIVGNNAIIFRASVPAVPGE